MEEKKICNLKSNEVNIELATPMLKQFLKIKRENQDSILMYRMGDFYETFFEDAIVASRDLEITLTSREAGELGRVPMAGVPAKSVDIYLSKLVEKGHKITICEQTQDPSEAKGLVERRVTKKITAGTLIDSAFLDSSKNNYLCAFYEAKSEKNDDNSKSSIYQEIFGLAYIDVSTSEFKITTVNLEQLKSELSRISPSEILVPVKKQKLMAFQVVQEEIPDVPEELLQNYNFTKCDENLFQENFATKKIKEIFNVNSLESFGMNQFPEGIVAAGVIVDYIQKTQLDNIPKFDTIKPYSLENYMCLDSSTRRNLELTETSKEKNKKGSLINAINRTSTSMGERLLNQWIQQPLQDINEILNRQNTVSELLGNPNVAVKLRELLEKVSDTERLATKISNNSVNPRDYLALKDSLMTLPEIQKLLQYATSPYLKKFQNFDSSLIDLANIIERTILPNPSINLKEGNIIKDNVSVELDYLKNIISGENDWLENYLKKEKERTGIKSLKISSNKNFGYYIEITHVNSSLVPNDYIRKQTLSNAERFTTIELKKHEVDVISAKTKIVDIEYDVFCNLRNYSKEFITAIRQISSDISILDVLLSFATIAKEYNYTCPMVDNSNVLKITNGRHPVVEQLMSMGKYVPNNLDIAYCSKDNQFIILTGPNMAGKSTFMRQNALIAILAQVGSFVPAESCRIGLIDQIFTRVGSVDDLSIGQSTFMVEMNETAYILNSATERSLILLDEIGRGTSTYDGVAIAWSVSEYIANEIRARTIFATHYHELNVLCEQSPFIKNFKMTILEKEDEIEFLYKVVEGGTSKSYGIQVAQMAGLPATVISRSKNLMSKMQKDYSKNLSKNQKELLEEAPQLNLFEDN